MRFTNRQILKIAGPILVSVLMEHLIGMTDTAFLGRVGEVELGASALAGVYYLAIFMLGFGFSTGVQIMIGRRNGEGNYTAIGELFNQGFVFQFLLATFIFFATRFGSPLLLRHLIDSPQVYEATLEYMNRRIFGLFFSFTALMFRAFYVGIADTRTLTANSLVMVGTNVVLNYILIFGKLGFPALGIAGAAIASVLAEVVALFYRIHRLEDRPAEISSLPFPPHRNPLTQTDFGYLDLDNGAGIYFYQHLVFIFYRCRTPRRTAFSHYQCVKEYLLPFLYYRQCFRHYRQFIGK